MKTSCCSINAFFSGWFLGQGKLAICVL